MRTKNLPRGGRSAAVVSGQQLEQMHLIWGALNKAYELKIARFEKYDFYAIYDLQKLVGYYGDRVGFNTFVKTLFAPHFDKARNVQAVLSKQMRPDAFLYVSQKQLLVIFEFKAQSVAGSVDEKIQTGPYKLWLYEKLLRPAQITINYEYVISNLFASAAYDDLRKYYLAHSQIKLHILEASGALASTFNIKSYFA